MVLKMQTDYALRTLIYLAHVGGQASVQDVAAAYGISKDHLFKVVQQLVRLGYVASRPGRTGGIRLAVDPATVNCGDVVAGFEGRHGLLPCVRDPSHCVLEPGCVLRGALIEAEDALYGVLERLTIVDVLRANSAATGNGGGGNGRGGVYNLTIRGRALDAQAEDGDGDGNGNANGNGNGNANAHGNANGDRDGDGDDSERAGD